MSSVLVAFACVGFFGLGLFVGSLTGDFERCVFGPTSFAWSRIVGMVLLTVGIFGALLSR